jgi:hypothetical protein
MLNKLPKCRLCLGKCLINGFPRVHLDNLDRRENTDSSSPGIAPVTVAIRGRRGGRRGREPRGCWYKKKNFTLIRAASGGPEARAHLPPAPQRPLVTDSVSGCYCVLLLLSLCPLCWVDGWRETGVMRCVPFHDVFKLIVVMSYSDRNNARQLGVCVPLTNIKAACS